MGLWVVVVVVIGVRRKKKLSGLTPDPKKHRYLTFAISNLPPPMFAVYSPLRGGRFRGRCCVSKLKLSECSFDFELRWQLIAPGQE